MNVFFVFNSYETHVVGLYWQDGDDIAHEVWSERHGRFNKRVKNEKLRKLRPELTNSHVDGYAAETKDLESAKSYLGKSPDLVKKLPKADL